MTRRSRDLILSAGAGALILAIIVRRRKLFGLLCIALAYCIARLAVWL